MNIEVLCDDVEVKKATEKKLSTLAEESGMDTSICEFCGLPLDDSVRWRRTLDGAGAHNDCIPLGG